MPLRTFSRNQAWLFPPTVEELIPLTHPARFVGAFVDALERSEWDAMEIPVDGNPKGAPSYDPRALLSVWLYGFMTGVRSSRKVEQACRDCIPYLWLTGWQHPDHNTLWRFYQANRQQLRKLLKRTVHVALDLGLVDLVLQAVDGTKVAANAARDRMVDAAGVERLLDRVDAALADLEAQNGGGAERSAPALPKELSEAKALKERIERAKKRLEDEERTRVNLTDTDAGLVRSHPGIMVGYNGQAVVSPVRQGKSAGLLITAAEVTTEPNDQGQLAAMIQAGVAPISWTPEH
ncbi:MAG: transposase [Chloroflexi bacterium]|nr:transposase [Chloroflexota bacterium]